MNNQQDSLFERKKKERISERSIREKEKKRKKHSKPSKNHTKQVKTRAINSKKQENLPTSSDSSSKKLPEKPKKFKDLYENKKQAMKESFEEDGLVGMMNKHMFGTGNLLVKFVTVYVGSPRLAKFLINFGSKHVKSLIGVVAFIGALTSFLLMLPMLILFTIMIVFMVMIGGLTVIISEDDSVNLEGVNTSNVTGVSINKNGSSSQSDIHQTRQDALTPPEVRGKLLWGNWNKINSVFKTPRPRTGYHYGTDYDIIEDDGKVPVFPVADGEVIQVGVQPKYICSGMESYGNFVTILHPDIIHTNGKAFTTRYGHLKYAPNVKVGDKVTINTVIGILGSTGCSSGPHVHFELMPGGRENTNQKIGVDPKYYLMCSETETAQETGNNLKKCYEYQKKVRGL